MNTPYIAPVFPANEADRIRSLHQLEILDTEPQPELDALVRAASLVCQVPISLISLVDSDRQWFKAKIGLDATQTPRDISFCGHAILGDEVFEVSDATQDERFKNNPLVLTDPDIRFYAGAPIKLSDGSNVGSFCVIDRIPKYLTVDQRQILVDLARAASSMLENAHHIHQVAEWKRNVEQSSEAKLKLASIVEQSDDAILSKDREGFVTSWNHGAERMFGYTEQEIIGRPASVLFPGDKLVEEKAIVEKLKRGEMVSNFETMRRHKSGRLINVSISMSILVGENGKMVGISTIIRDISVRVAQEQDIRKSEVQHKALINAMYEGVLFQLSDSTIVSCNESAERLLGMRSDQLVGRKTSDAICHCVREDMTTLKPEQYPAMIALASGQDVKDAVMGVYKPDGSFAWISMNAKPMFDSGNSQPTAAVCTFVDITNKKLAQEELKQHERFLAALTNSIPGMVAYWDSDLHCRFANDGYQAWLNAPAESTLGLHISQLLDEETIATLRSHILKTLAGETVRFERTIVQPDGTKKYALAHYIPDFHGGVVKGFIVMIADISDVKATQFELERLNKELEVSAIAANTASESKGQFLANMSHEIRTPMNAILGLLELLQSTELTSRQRDYVSKTEGAAQSLLGLLNDILDFSKVEAGKMTLEFEPFRLDKLFRNLSVVLSANVGAKDIEVLFDIDASLPEVVNGDAMRLQQVLINLGGNAVKFTNEGQVVLGLKKKGLKNGKVAIEFSIKDSGIGIAPEHQKQIFSSFSQAEASTTRRFGGTGLGLSISKRLIELMGSEIHVESELGRGSVFSFVIEFPVVEDIPVELVVPHPDVRASKRVLVIDDNPVASHLTEQMISSWGWPVDVCHSGEEAISRISQEQALCPSEFPYPLIYVDWQMPKMDGWETTKRIRDLAKRQFGPGPTIIMVTAHGRETLAQRSVEEQDMLNGFLVKPVTASMLYDCFVDAHANNKSVRELSKGRSSQRELVGMRILVVEDNLINQQIADELLSAAGAIVSLAANGQSGVDAVAAAAPQFDVVLMDIQMPVLDGYGATKIIREQLGLKDLPIIAMTANAMSSDREACLAAGMNEHVGKPFDISKLISMLVELTDFKVESILDSYVQTAPVVNRTPELSGLDLSTALSRMSGMRSLYVRTARDFVKILGDVVFELEEKIRGGETQSFLMMLHTLKGNAGTLGATDLAKKAGQMEADYKQGSSDVQLLSELPALGALVSDCRIMLNKAIALLDVSVSAAKVPVDFVMSKELLAEIRQLDDLLTQFDLSALLQFSGLREKLEGVPEGFADQLDEALQSLELDKAHELCANLLSKY